MQHHLKKIVVENVAASPEEVMDVVAIMFDDMKVIIPNQMTTMWGDMKRKIIHYLLKSLKVIVIDVV
jgi:nitrogen fixation/metabolism regulation signal transduction histidine kinase